MRILDLFCGAGGAAMGYHRSGFEVVGVDINPQPRYPFAFVQMDALEALRVLLAGVYITDNNGRKWYLIDFDAIHASPPCQKFSMIQRIVKTKEKWPDLVDPTRQLLIKTGKPYVIENVENAPLRIDILLCGSMFGLGMIRHRVFESSVPMPLLTLTCNHHSMMYDPWHYGTDQLIQMSKGMGIDWMKKREEVREAIPPAYTEFIGRQLIAALQEDERDSQ